MPREPAIIETARGLVRALVASSPWLGGVPSTDKTSLNLADWLAAHALSCSRPLHLLTMATRVLLSLPTAKTELVVRGVYGAGKTSALPCWQPTLPYEDIMSTMRLGRTLPSPQWRPLCTDSSLEDRAHSPVAIRLASGPRITPSGTLAWSWPPLASIWHSFGITTGPLTHAVDYAELFIYDEAQQEAPRSAPT